MHPRLQGAVMTWASSTFIVVYIVMMGVSLYQNGGIEELSVNPMVVSADPHTGSFVGYFVASS